MMHDQPMPEAPYPLISEDFYWDIFRRGYSLGDTPYFKSFDTGNRGSYGTDWWLTKYWRDWTSFGCAEGEIVEVFHMISGYQTPSDPPPVIVLSGHTHKVHEFRISRAGENGAIEMRYLDDYSNSYNHNSSQSLDNAQDKAIWLDEHTPLFMTSGAINKREPNLRVINMEGNKITDMKMVHVSTLENLLSNPLRSEPKILDFGNVVRLKSKAKNLRIYNDGPHPVSVNININEDTNSEFSFIKIPSEVIPSYGMIQVPIKFIPKSTGIKSAICKITNTINGQTKTFLAVKLKGAGISPTLLPLPGLMKQEIPLCQGWNLISFQINNCYYEGTSPTVFIPAGIIQQDVGSLADWLSNDASSPLRDEADPDKAGNWQRVTSFDSAGAHILDKDLPPQINTLKYMSAGYGYWIKIEDTEGAELVFPANCSGI